MAASVTVVMSGDDTRLIAANNRLLAAQQKALDNYQKAINKGREAQQENTKGSSILENANDKLVKYASSMGVAAAGAAALRAVWQQINKEQEQGLNALKQTQPSDSRLLQISSSPEEFRKLRSESDSLSAQTGVDRNVVREVMFSGISEGFKDVVPEIIKANQVLNPKAAASVAGQVPSLFQGKIGALESVDLTLRAAKESRLNFEDLAKALPSAAEGGAIAKASPEETLATLSVLASRFKSGDVAADRIKAFGAVAGIDSGGMTAEQKATEQKKVDSAQKELRSKEERVADIQRKLDDKNTKKEARPELELRLSRAKRDVSEFDQSRLKMPEQRQEFAGQGIVQVVKRLQSMSEGDRQNFLGSSQELNVAFTVLKEELPAIEKRLADLKGERTKFAEGGGILRDQVAIANKDEEMTAIRNEQIAQRKLEINNADKFGISGAAASGATADATASLTDDGLVTRTVGGMIAKPAATAAAAFGADQSTAAGFASGLTRGVTNSFFGGGAVSPYQKNTIVTGNPPGSDQSAAIAPTIDASGLNAAADKMQEAAKLNLEAAKLRASQSPPSISGAARAQAATVGGY